MGTEPPAGSAGIMPERRRYAYAGELLEARLPRDRVAHCSSGRATAAGRDRAGPDESQRRAADLSPPPSLSVQPVTLIANGGSDCGCAQPSVTLMTMPE